MVAKAGRGTLTALVKFLVTSVTGDNLTYSTSAQPHGLQVPVAEFQKREGGHDRKVTFSPKKNLVLSAPSVIVAFTRQRCRMNGSLRYKQLMEPHRDRCSSEAGARLASRLKVTLDYMSKTRVRVNMVLDAFKILSPKFRNM